MKSKPDYGIDAPKIIKIFGFIGTVLLMAAVLGNFFLPHHWLSYVLIFFLYISSFFTFYPVVAIFIGSKFFKFREREWLFDRLSLLGHEKVLDVGCGHELLLIGAAKRIFTGRVYGLDLWVQRDQAFNSLKATLRNAELEGVKNKIEIITGDMSNMPFQDEFFDAVVSSWAIHNLSAKADREKTLLEIGRVLKPEGKVAILDIEYAKDYADFLKARGFNVELLGPRHTFGNKTYLVFAMKKITAKIYRT